MDTTEKHQELVEGNIEYARRLARTFYNKRQAIGVEREDLEGAAFIGLCDAAGRFDESKGMNFQTYSYLRIRGAMYDLLRYSGGIPRDLFNSIVEHDERSWKSPANDDDEGGDRDPFRYYMTRSAAELATFIDILDELNIKIHTSFEDEETELSYAKSNTPEYYSQQLDQRRYLRRFVKDLPTKEREVFILRIFLGLEMNDIKEILGGVSKSWLSRLLNRACERLEHMVQADHARKDYLFYQEAA